MTRTITLAAVAAALLAGCGSSPAPERYLLTVPPAAPVQAQGTRIALERVGVPGYLEGDRVASEAPGARIVFDEDDRWAEDPRVAITRALEGTLSAEPGLTVLAEPWPRRYRPDFRLQVDFDRVLRTTRGGASLSGHFIVMAGDGDEVLTIRPFSIEEAGLGGGEEEPSYDAFFAATSAALRRLSDEVVGALRGEGGTVGS